MRLLPALLLLPAPAFADTCTDRLSALLSTDLTASGPYIALNTNQMAGTEQVFRQMFVSDRHFLVEAVHPAGQPDTLHYEGGAWHSDGAGGWSLAWQIDADEAAAGIAAQRAALSGGVQSATCSETIVAGLIGETQWFGPELRVRYVVAPESDAVQELTYEYTLNGLEIVAHYAIEAAPDLELPLPPGG